METKKILALGIALGALLAGCTNYGESIEFGKSTLYYKDGVTKEEARKLGDLLKRIGYFSDQEQRDAQVVKDGDTYIVKFATKEDVEITDEIVQSFTFLKMQIAGEVFPGKEVKIQLTDENLEKRKEI